MQLIRDITSQSTWRYCPTTSNPADLITREIYAKAFISKQQCWNQGPSWLMKPTQEWPSVTDNHLQDNKENYTETQTISINLTNVQKSANLLNVIDITKYRTLNKTLRVTALVIHFTGKLSEKTKSNTVTAIDMKHARIALLQSVQQFYYGDILSKIKDKAKGKRPAIIHQLGLYLDDDSLIRCRERLQYAQLPQNTKFRILMPKESHLSTLIESHGLREQPSSQKNKNMSGEPVARGKVVLIHSETLRNQWKLGVIIQLHPGKDGLVRSVTLRTTKGNLISRPIEKLYPLEVLAEEDNLQDSKEKLKNPEEIRSTSEKRTRRAAARRAALKINKLYKLNEL